MLWSEGGDVIALLCALGLHKWDETGKESVGLCRYKVTYECAMCPKEKTKVLELHRFKDEPWEQTGAFSRDTGQRRYIKRCKDCRMPCKTMWG